MGDHDVAAELKEVDTLRPSGDLWTRLSRRIAEDARPASATALTIQTAPRKWETVGAGIFIKILALDEEKRRVSMLVRLGPKTDYPPHRHAGIEELYLLQGQLTVDDKTLHPGDYIYAEAGSIDICVYSETGCTCVLLTSTEDALL
jgi:quercetin dioxygenase-like cupin family protein